MWKFPEINVIGPCWWTVNFGSGNGLMPSGNKPLSEPVLTQLRVAIYGVIRHWVIISIFQVEVAQAFAKFS